MKKLALLFVCLNLSAQVSKVEPPMWWSGMHNTNVMVTLYGENLADYAVASNDLTITDVVRLENNNYLFVYLDFAAAKPGTYQLVLEHSQKESIQIPYELMERREGSALRKGYDSSDFIYLIMPDRFANGDPTNDSHPDLHEQSNRKDPWGRHGGDLQGIIDHLDYIAQLGVTAIWNTPVLEDNDPKGSYHMYAASDVYQIDRRFGSNEKYKQLSAELKKRNMKLIKDYVVNHWGLEHYMIQDLPSKDWINQWDEFTPSSHAKEIFSDPYAAEVDVKQLVTVGLSTAWPTLTKSNLNC